MFLIFKTPEGLMTLDTSEMPGVSTFGLTVTIDLGFFQDLIASLTSKGHHLAVVDY